MVNAEVSRTNDGGIRRYPILMESTISNAVVLFDGHGIGFCVAGGAFPIGHYSEDWEMSFFKEFSGSIVLSNEG